MSDQSRGLLSLDRAVMEAERLARLAQKRSLSQDVVVERPVSRSKLNTAENENGTTVFVEAVNHTSSVAAAVAPRVQDATLATPATTAQKTTDRKLEYPDGTIKKTWAFGHDRRRDIKIEEVLRRDSLRIAVLSSFQWQMEWLFSKINKDTKLVFVMQAKDEPTKAQCRRDAAAWSRPIRLCFPPMPGQVFCMHSKLMLLFYPDYLRIVVPSANLTNYDWGENGVLENTVFLIDLPRLAEDKANNNTLTPFAKSLCQFLEAMTLDQDIRPGVLKFDFSRTVDLAFVHTIGGSHLGPAAQTTGFPGLSSALRSLNLQSAPQDNLDVDFATSSVGSLDMRQIEALYRAFQGLEPDVPVPANKKGSRSAPPTKSIPFHERFRIIFPSHKTVEESTGGPDNGGTIFLQPEYYNKPTFPRQLLRDYKSQRTGLLSHNKLIFARTNKLAYVYTGSANLSQSAWGSMSLDRATKQAKLNCRNWECGVVMPVVTKLTALKGGAKHETDAARTSSPKSPPPEETNEEDMSTESEDEETDLNTNVTETIPEDDASTESEDDAIDPSRTRADIVTTRSGDALSLDVFKETLDVPFMWPAEEYSQGQKPWFVTRWRS